MSQCQDPRGYDKRPTDPRFARPDKSCAVFYLGIDFGQEVRQALFSGADARLEISHPHYHYSAPLPDVLVESLRGDFKRQ